MEEDLSQVEMLANINEEAEQKTTDGKTE